MRDAMFGRKPDEPVTIRVTESPADLQRGDVIVFWDTGDAIVTATLDCAEERSGRTMTWRWLFLSSGAMIEVVGGANTIYERTEVIGQETEAFRVLTAPVEAGGALQFFEARQQDGAELSDPVSVRIGDRGYRLKSTGSFRCTRVGPLDLPVWRDTADDERNNVYFRMEADDHATVLGIWTTDIALLTGRPLAHAEIKGLYGA